MTGVRDVAELLQELLRRTHLSSPSDLAGVVADQAASVDARDVALYLVDYEQAELVPLHPAEAERLSVAGTVGGRAFSSTSILRTPEDAGERLWIPLLDGTERLGVMAMSFAASVSDELEAACERYAHLVAVLIVTKSAYGDSFTVTRRRTGMTIAAELAWELAPPLVFATDGVALAGMLEPPYDNGGDAIDYAVNGRTLHLGIFDGMGHGLAAAGVTSFALAAYRHSRRAGKDLIETFNAMDGAVGEQFPDSRYVTAVIAELELDAGRLSWISAGHPWPMVIRGGRLARTLRAGGSTPLGLGLGVQPSMGDEQLEPGDLLLLYTDGLTEARGPGGHRFGENALAAFIEREAAGGFTAPETLRRLRHAVIGAADGPLRDDASALLVEWRPGAEKTLAPQAA
jgi:serine/threonine protein phosphatase PrpC